MWLPIVYRSFYDVPRMVAFAHAGQTYLLDSAFDDVADDYLPSYKVYLLSDLSLDDVSALLDWRSLAGRGVAIGIVSVESVEFDETKRSAINANLLGSVTSK